MNELMVLFIFLILVRYIYIIIYYLTNYIYFTVPIYDAQEVDFDIKTDLEHLHQVLLIYRDILQSLWRSNICLDMCRDHVVEDNEALLKYASCVLQDHLNK